MFPDRLPKHPTAGISKLYISGPMSGREDHNFPAFHEVARRERGYGFDVVSPAELDLEEKGGVPDPVEVGGAEYVEYLSRDVLHVVGVDAVLVLPEWQRSRGAKFEAYIAAGLEKPVYSSVNRERIAIHEIEEKRTEETILAEAARLVDGTRGSDYGHPYDDFGRTAAIVSAILGVEVSRHQIPLIMIAVKLSRHTNKPQRDNMTDIAGYARTAEMVAEKEGKWR